MYTFSTQNKDINNVNINMRQELDSLSNEFGIHILYIRNNKFVRCTCFDDTEKTGDPKCKMCFGSGYFASIQKFKTIESSTSPYSSNNKTKPLAIGAVDNKEAVYYLDYSVLPKERDFILKVTWKDDKPIDVIRVLEIANVYEMRGDSGRVEAFGANTLNKADMVQTFDRMLKRLPPKATKLLGKGGKYIWPMKLLIPKNETD